MIFYHDLAETSLDPTGSHRILDGSGKISPDLARSRRVSKKSGESVSPETDHHPSATRTDESVTATGQLRVEKPPTRTVTGRLLVGQKPDPPNPWTTLLITPCKSLACSNTTTHHKTNHKHHKYKMFTSIEIE